MHSSLRRRPATGQRGREPPIDLNKEGRVKVAVRCRPPFEDELENPDYHDVVTMGEMPEMRPGGGGGTHLPLTRVALEMGPRATRDFHFDYVFGPRTEQDDVYDRMAGHIVHGVLNGVNGMVMAYGQVRGREGCTFKEYKYRLVLLCSVCVVRTLGCGLCVSS